MPRRREVITTPSELAHISTLQSAAWQARHIATNLEGVVSDLFDEFWAQQTDTEREKLLNWAKSLTETNCWFIDFALAKLILKKEEQSSTSLVLT